MTIIKRGVRKLISNASFDNIFKNDTAVDLKTNHSTTKLEIAQLTFKQKSLTGFTFVECAIFVSQVPRYNRMGHFRAKCCAF